MTVLASDQRPEEKISLQSISFFAQQVRLKWEKFDNDLKTKENQD